jgi:hypothetical protein
MALEETDVIDLITSSSDGRLNLPSGTPCVLWHSIGRRLKTTQERRRLHSQGGPWERVSPTTQVISAKRDLSQENWSSCVVDGLRG